jgi:thymidylate synthase
MTAESPEPSVASRDPRSNTFHGSTSRVYPAIIRHLRDRRVNESRAGDTKEDLVVKVVSKNPRERMLFRPKANWAFGLQEAFAYWMGRNPGHVQRYNSKMEDFMYQREDEDEPKLHGSAYGRYMRRLPHDQIKRVIHQLRDNPESRRALVNIHNSYVEDYDRGDVACTIYLQFIIRHGDLHCVANLRSQDMLWGYPYDVHAFQWIQEVIAGILDVGLGTYTHIMNSCHYYTDFEERVHESAQEASWTQGPDIRLEQAVLEDVMQHLDSGLRTARQGSIPDIEISYIEDRSQYYADWLRTMTAYEQRRFHSGDWEEIADQVETAPLAAFLTTLD